jgi:hypothetical protein
MEINLQWHSSWILLLVADSEWYSLTLEQTPTGPFQENKKKAYFITPGNGRKYHFLRVVIEVKQCHVFERHLIIDKGPALWHRVGWLLR